MVNASVASLARKLLVRRFGVRSELRGHMSVALEEIIITEPGTVTSESNSRRGSPRLIVLCAATFIVVLHLVTASRYGIFRDELYYIACARHLGFGYVDHPPLIAWITWLVLHVFGSSLLALRLLPALASGVLVWMTAQLSREWGGGRYAQILAAISIIPVPIYLILQHWLTMNAFEPLLWTATMWAASRVVLRGQVRYWLLTGALVGVGLENKYSMLLLAGGIVVGFLLTPERKCLGSRAFVEGSLVAVGLAVPNFIWLLRNHFPFLEFERNARASSSQMMRDPIHFLGDQALIMNPLVALLAVLGVVWLFGSAPKALRFAGWASVLVIVCLVALKAKNYYVSPIYPTLLAAGAIWSERATSGRFATLRVVYPSLLLLTGAVVAPLVMPILPVPRLLSYSMAWHGFTPVRYEAQSSGVLPQYFADEFGWENMARTTATVYSSLPMNERTTTAIFANDYGEASAIDFFGPRYGLPPSISKAETFWLWGPRQYTGQTVIVLGSDGQEDQALFHSVQPVGIVHDPYSRPDEQFTVFLCRGLRPSLVELWPSVKAW